MDQPVIIDQKFKNIQYPDNYNELLKIVGNQYRFTPKVAQLLENSLTKLQEFISEFKPDYIIVGGRSRYFLLSLLKLAKIDCEIIEIDHSVNVARSRAEKETPEGEIDLMKNFDNLLASKGITLDKKYIFLEEHIDSGIKASGVSDAFRSIGFTPEDFRFCSLIAKPYYSTQMGIITKTETQEFILPFEIDNDGYFFLSQMGGASFSDEANKQEIFRINMELITKNL